MDNQQKKQLDRYSMMIVSKYFKTIGDFIKMIQICKKFEEIPEMFHFNPVKLMMKTNLFPNIETYHIFTKKEQKIKGYEKYVYWNEVNYITYLNKKENEEYKNVQFTSNDWVKYKSFKGATILNKYSLSQCDSAEIDLTGITKIENCCFMGNEIVKHIKLDKRITTIPEHCFSGCSSLVELDLSYIKILGSYCFNYCTSLTALTLPEMFFKNEPNCFEGLNELEKIETKGIKVIEANMNYSIYEPFKRNGIDVKGSISFNNYDRIKYGNEIPEEVSIINSYCYYNVTTLGDVILPKSVTKLDQYCFNYCSIKSIDLSHVIESDCYFYNCNELSSITLSKKIIDNPSENNYFFCNYLTSLKNIELSDTDHIPIVSNHLRKLMEEKGYKYDNCIYTKEDYYENDAIIPEEVNIIDNFVFYYNNNVKKITIPSNISYIRTNNFFSMANLESIEIQSTNIECDGSFFNDLPKIKELDLRGITSFGPNSLCSCFFLTKLIIQNIPIENGLINCDSLKEIEIIGIENNEYEHLINYKFANILENKGINCKRKGFYKYESVSSEETFCIPDGVNEICPYSFSYCSLKEIKIPSSVTLIYSYAFNYCTRAIHLMIEGNPQIEKNAICGCFQLIQNQHELKQYS